MNNSTSDGRKSRLSTWDRIVFFIIIIPLFVFMGRIIWAFGGVDNPVTENKVEKRGQAYLEENYPGLYEQVKTQNSGNAYENQDGNWVVQYFSREKNNDMFSKILFSFSLVFDKDLNLITDGYQEYYLKGGSVYSDYSTQFYRDVHKLIYPRYKNQPLPIEGKFNERLDDYDFEDSWFYEAGDGIVYTGDYLDPSAEHDRQELYAKYGHINLKFFMETGGYEDYAEVTNAVLDILEENDMNYHSMRIYMWFRESDIIFCEGNFTKEAIDTDLEKAINDGTYVFTQAEYDRMKAAGEEIPTIEVGSLMDVIVEGSKEIADKE